MQNSIKHLAILVVGVLSLLPISIAIVCGAASIINSIFLYVICTVGMFGLLKKGILNSDLDFKHISQFNTLSSQDPVHCEIREIVESLSLIANIKLPNIYIKKRQGALPQIGIECVTHPDYTIIFSEDLVNRFKQGISRSQLSLLVSHELGHFYYRDHLWAALVILSQSTYALQSVLAVGITLWIVPSFFLITFVSVAFGFGLQSVLSRLHSRFCEYTADKFAAELCQNPYEMKNLFEHIAREYEYWGMATYQNHFAEYKIHSDYHIAPLLEWRHYLSSQKKLSEKQSSDLILLSRQLLHYYPFNRNHASLSVGQYWLTWFNHYPTSEERKNQFK